MSCLLQVRKFWLVEQKDGRMSVSSDEESGWLQRRHIVSLCSSLPLFSWLRKQTSYQTALAPASFVQQNFLFGS